MTNRALQGLLLVSITFAGIRDTCVSAAEDHDQRQHTPSPKEIDFTRDIQPIFQRACLSCHGTEKQKSDYRLDVRDVAFKGGESYAPNIIPGKSQDSPLIRFVAGTGDLVMPPEGDRLSSKEVELLRRWVDQGAHWPDNAAGKVHDKADLWSLKPLVRPDVPTIGTDRRPTNPIDAFIHAKLTEHKFSFSLEADRRTLIRRLYFDLIGLPPTPDEVDAFDSDPDENAFEGLVNRLLDSPRYGERWARHWMDSSHFAETHGHDQDRIRENAWPYRDYLIAAFNDDIPYSQFVKEQIAGDAFFPDRPAAIAALGFLAAGPWDESSLRDIREDTIDRQVARYLDRDDMLATIMNNFTSTTVQCARCHDHKFDPITQSDYYSMQAVLSGVERANRAYDTDVGVFQKRRALTQRKSELEQRHPSMMSNLMSLEIQNQVAEWESRQAVTHPKWHIVDAKSYSSSDGATLTKLPDGSILSGGSRPETDTVTIVSGPVATFPLAQSQVTTVGAVGSSHDPAIPSSAAKPLETPTSNMRTITAIRLEVMTDDSLPRRGPGRHDNGNFHLSEIEVYSDDRSVPETLINASSDFNQQGWEIQKAIDHSEPTAWGIDPKEGSPHWAIFELKEPLSVSPDVDSNSATPSNRSEDRTTSRLTIVLKQLHGRAHLIGRMRLSITDAVTPVSVDSLPESIGSILAVPKERRTDTQRLELAIFQQLDAVKRSLSSLPKPSHVYAAAADFEPDGSLRPPPGPRPIHVLHRGDIRQPRDEARPGAITAVSTLTSRFDIPEGAPESARRAALAKWLTDRENPLTWRSIVNRIWHYHFGRGLVGTLNDFGHMGEAPSHPELLDWLALEFRDHGQSMKSLHRLILTSHTYRQRVEIAASNPDDEANLRRIQQAQLSVDADNRLLWRMNRTRLDAESVRDAVLAISGRLDLRMGGPSDRQFDLKPGIHVTPRVDYGKFDLNSDLGRRRSIYRFLFRTLPDPFMESLDCPSGDQITPVRGNSVTVQQALALWNDAFIANHCEQIASRIQRELAPQDGDGTANRTTSDAEIDRAFRLILSRHPKPNEIQDFLDYTAKHGLANLCRLLLNSNEFLFVN